MLSARNSRSRGVYRLFLLSYAVILVITLSACLIYTVKIYSQMMNETALSKQALLSSLESDVENNLKDLEDYANTLAFDKELMLCIQHPDIYSSVDLKRVLSNKGPLKGYMLDSFLYLSESDEVVTANIRMPAERFFSIIYQFEDLPLDRLRQDYLLPYRFNTCLPSLRLRQYDAAQTVEVIPYVQSLPISTLASPPAQLVVLLDARQMFRQAEMIYAGTAAEIYIADSDGRLVYSSPDAAPLEAGSLSGNNEVERTKSGFLISRTSGVNGWKYLISMPYRLYFEQNMGTWLFLGGVFLAYLVVGLFLVRWLARRSYRPVKDISALIAGSEAITAPGQNEFDMIRHTLMKQIKSHKELSSALEAQQPVVLRDCLAHLLQGQVTDVAAARLQLQGLGVSFETDCFLCAIVAFDLDSPYFTGGDPLAENLSLAKLVVENVGCELLEDVFTCYKLDMFDNQSLFILCPRGDADREDIDAQAAKRLGDLMEFSHRLELGLRAGVSQPEEGLDRLFLCYDGARKAVEYNRFDTSDKPSLFRQAVTAENDYYFPPEAERQLAQAMRGGNSEEAHGLLAHLFQTNFSDRHISSIAAYSFLYQLAATVQQTINSMSLARGEGAPFDEKALESVLKCSGAERAHRRLDELIDQLVPDGRECASSRTNQLAEKIAAYIDAHADSDWLDLNTLSREFGVTPQYISIIFKKLRNENIKDYISKQKLAQAKSLLTETDLPIREIAARLGYASEISIIRLFRKYEGITPSNYRGLYRK